MIDPLFQAVVTFEKTATNQPHGGSGGSIDHVNDEPCDGGDGVFARQTFTFAKVFKDSRIGEAGVMLDIQQVSSSVSLSCFVGSGDKELLVAAVACALMLRLSWSTLMWFGRF